MNMSHAAALETWSRDTVEPWTSAHVESESYERFINFKLINGLTNVVLVAVKIAFVLLTSAKKDSPGLQPN